MSEFAHKLIDWQRGHGRHDLPWQRRAGEPPDPYRIWLSEIMLQQTQVSAVIPYYLRFLERFPDLAALAAAPADAVLAAWSGLGYYARARNLQRCAQQLMQAHGGRFPRGTAELARLPGIGRSTAAAIAAFAWGTRAAILDGNVKRVLARRFGITGFPGAKPVEAQLWALAESLLPARDIESYTQGLMDLGATVCTRSRPRCIECPLRAECVAWRENRVRELPAARPRRALPTRSATVLVALQGGRVLLERRPPSGIWGGLLSLPELPEGAAPAESAQRLFGLTLARCKALAPLQHGFTHFRLELRPLLGEVATMPTRTQAPGFEWLPLEQIGSAALPAPVRKLLAKLAEPSLV